MYQRILQQQLEKLSTQWSVISVTGPRQSGKTTLCKMAFPDYQYVNLERSTTCELIRQDIEGYLLSYPHGLIIDVLVRKKLTHKSKSYESKQCRSR